VNLGRTFVVASNVFREVIRDRVLYLIGFFAIVLVAAAVLIPAVAANTEDQIVPDLGLAAIALLGLGIAVFVGTGLVNKEIEKRTVHVMIAKPISMAEFIVGKHWGLSAVLTVLVLAMTGVFLAVLSVQQIPYSLGSILLSALFQILELSLITAVAILFGVFTSSLLAVLLTLAVYLMGHFSRDLLTLGSLTQNTGARQAIEAAYLVLPDLERLNLKNQAVYGMEILPKPLDLLGDAAYSLVYTALLLAIATLIFSRREF
jgi:ABC-type transport system involved in multi-copper enzyme maturation permease subunit